MLWRRVRHAGRTTARVVLASLLLTTGCALNRSQVKSLSDRDAGRIQFDPVVATTIGALNALTAQCGPARNRRVRTEERQVYRVEGIITRVKRERDHDIHLVLRDPSQVRETLVVEADDPDFRLNVTSPYRSKLSAGRQMLEALMLRSTATPASDLVGLRVAVTGVGFFDINHLQVGRARSCIELHPLLSIERLP